MNGISGALQTRRPCAPTESSHQPLCQPLPRFISRGVFAKPPPPHPSLYVHFNERVAHLLIFNPCAFAAIALFIYLFIYVSSHTVTPLKPFLSRSLFQQAAAGHRDAFRDRHICILHIAVVKFCICLGDTRRLVHSFSQLRCVAPAYPCTRLSIQTARLPSFHLFFFFFFLSLPHLLPRNP